MALRPVASEARTWFASPHLEPRGQTPQFAPADGDGKVASLRDPYLGGNRGTEPSELVERLSHLFDGRTLDKIGV